MNKDDKLIAELLELSVWSSLNQNIDLELLLLRGHLIIDTILEATLTEIMNEDFSDFSFYRKILFLETQKSFKQKQVELVIKSLFIINKMRNQMAHEYNFDIDKVVLQNWAQNILDNLDGSKFSKYTSRTKIVHAFSRIAFFLASFHK
jgi:hypothetical protein